MNIIEQGALRELAVFLYGELNVQHVINAVNQWEAKTLSGAEKKTGVLAELEVLGVELLESDQNLIVELVVRLLGLGTTAS